MPNDRAPRTLREAFGPEQGFIDQDDLPREPLTPAEAVLLVLVWASSLSMGAAFLGWVFGTFAQ